MNRLEELKNVELGEKIGYKKGFEAARKQFERPHGEWIPINIHGETWEYKCSICGAEVDTDFPNCPYCLADMQKDDRKMPFKAEVRSHEE